MVVTADCGIASLSCTQEKFVPNSSKFS